MKKIRGMPKKKKILPVGKTTSFPIVGIGASAGGLEAYQELLKNLSARPGMAFVFIMHLSPGHKSMLTELLSKSTKMPVKEIKSGTPIEINHIYVIPPGVNVSIAGGKLKLNKMRDAGLKRMPVDWFFRSLAEEQGNRGIGVILSGTATDGTLGAEAIKAEGGIIFAEDEKSAKYGGMPQSAIGAGCADFVLSPKRIAHELERIAKHPLISSGRLVKTDKSIIRSAKGLEGIFDILRSAKGLDFIHYKTPTISRRVSRRMVLLKLENLRSYIKYLRENKDEVENLYEDLLLKVTGFFRDPKVFHTLQKRIIPAILKNKTKGQEVRIWVPGCSSGEEAYSIAMCLMESLGNKRSAVPVRIFATDVSESNIHKARQGIYGKNIQNDIAPERLKRFFTKTGSSYKVSKLLRDMCIFSKQNVFSDPPFSNLDLISCRNLIIYFQPILQKKVFHNFHYGLKPGGFLLLGNSESAGGYSNLFKTLDRTQRIFVKKYLSGEPKFKLGQKYYPPKKSEIKEMPGIRKGKEPDTGNLVERIVLNEYAPCGVLIDGDMEVVQFRGHTGRYLESAAGKPSHNLFKLAPRGLFQPLHTAIYKARGTKHTVKIEAGDVKYNGRKMRVNITVIPVKSGPLKEEFFLVLFDEISRAVMPQNVPKVRGKSAVKDEKYVESLQKELSETKEYLQTIIEEQENVNEEVKTANEEILSSNEELLSTNEELETAKEELQSSNEELITTNEELQNRNKEVFLLNNDLINLLTSINMPVIMMGTDLCVRRITPQTEKVLNVISSDVGRPISRIKLNVDIPDFEKILLEVVDTLHSKTFEVKDKEGNWYLVYVRPYRTLDNKINGVVAIFDDITERKQLENELAQSKEEEFKTVFDNAIDGILIADMENKKLYRGNNSICRMLGYSPQEIGNLEVMDIHPEKDLPYVIEQFERQAKGEIHLAEDLPVKRKDGSIFYADVNSTTIVIAGKVYIIGFFRDTTERKQAEEALNKAHSELKKTHSDLKKAHSELEQRVKKRTAELCENNALLLKTIEEKNHIQKVLQETEKLAGAGKLAAQIAHEINNPMAGIKNSFLLIKDAIPKNHQYFEYVGRIEKEIDRVSQILRQMFDLYRPGTPPVNQFRLYNTIKDIVELLKVARREKQVNILIDCDEKIIVTLSDALLRQVLYNIVLNAIEVSKSDQTIKIIACADDGRLNISICDQGPGIDEEIKDKIFEPFFTTGIGGPKSGLGLGLAITKDIISAMDGTIDFKSEKNKGTVFDISIPVEHSQEKNLFGRI